MINHMLTTNSGNLKLTSEIIKPSLHGLIILFATFILSINWYHNYLIKKDLAEIP